MKKNKLRIKAAFYIPSWEQQCCFHQVEYGVGKSFSRVSTTITLSADYRNVVNTFLEYKKMRHGIMQL